MYMYNKSDIGWQTAEHEAGDVNINTPKKDIQKFTFISYRMYYWFIHLVILYFLL